MSERDFPSRGQTARPEEVTHPDPVPDAEPGIEEPEGDMVEQRQEAAADEAGGTESLDPPPPDAEEADVIEQRQIVEDGEEEYR